MKSFVLTCLVFARIVAIPTVSLSSNPISSLPSHLKTKNASSVAKCERREEERNLVARSRCNNCNRPLRTCVCSSLPSELIQTSTEVLILQHPREFRRASLSTVPLISLILKKCTVKVGFNFSLTQLDLVKEYIDRGIKPLLMFPGSSAISLDDEFFGEDEIDRKNILNGIKQKEQLLILVDGTWSQAKSMLKQSPDLVNCCQQIQLMNEHDSLYDDVRKEPEKYCISTLEACANVLAFLEPNPEVALEAKKFLEESMKLMVETKKTMKDEDDSNPRFIEKKARIYGMNKRRNEIKKKLFENR